MWSLERGGTADGSLKLTCAARYNLPTLPAPTRFVGLWGLPGGGARAALRLLACTDGGRLMRLRPGGNPVDLEVHIKVRGVSVCAGWQELEWGMRDRVHCFALRRC